ncbi:MAG: tRNA-dihydrouridine synthase [Candidatus Amesbacteria bacterium]|nr:tRNA-dihydrouridine synthase [Candidatus Amesbacteria bacterium]
MTFWQKLAKKKKPFLALAPMEDVTDVVFRQVIEEIAPPDVFFTEFTNVEAILHNAPSDPPLNLRGGRKGELLNNPALYRLLLSKTKIPTVAQIWGTNPESFYKSAQIISDMGFSGIDINMGCPQRPELKIGACAALIKNHTLASEIIDAVRRGTKSPVSVKTRIGIKEIQTEDWIGFLLTQKLDALTVHGRTVKEMSAVPAHWDEIAKVVKMKGDTIIIGNGDVKNKQDAGHRAQETGADGVMIGRGVFENPWCFSDHTSTKEEKINLLKRHLELWQETWGDKKNFSVLKKYFKIYVRDFDGASELRAKLMEAKSIEVLKILIQKFL